MSLFLKDFESGHSQHHFFYFKSVDLIPAKILR